MTGTTTSPTPVTLAGLAADFEDNVPNIADRNAAMAANRATLLENRRDEFRRAREAGRPPRLDFTDDELQHEMVIVLVALKYLDRSLGDPVETLLRHLNVGGWRCGKTRAGSSWASVFVNNVQYTIRYSGGRISPEHLALSLAMRANRHRGVEFVELIRVPQTTRSFCPQVSLELQRLNGPFGSDVVLRSEYRGYAPPAISVQVLRQWFDRRFDEL